VPLGLLGKAAASPSFSPRKFVETILANAALAGTGTVTVPAAFIV